MNLAVVGLGSFTIFLGIVMLVLGSKSRGEMEIDLGKFKGPIWFLVIIVGISTTLMGFMLT